MRNYFRRLGLALGAILGAIAIGIALDNDLGIPIAVYPSEPLYTNALRHLLASKV